MSAERNDDAYGETFELLRELDISGRTSLDMLSDPERAVAVLRHAKKAEKVRNRAAFAIANWHSGFDPRPPVYAPPPPELDEAGPPSLSGLEYIWSLPQTAIIELLLEGVAAALAAAGGFEALQRTFHEIEHFDFD